MRRSSHPTKCRSELKFVTSHLGGGGWYLSVRSTHDVHCINDHDDQFRLPASTGFVKDRLKGRARGLVSTIEGLRGRPDQAKAELNRAKPWPAPDSRIRNRPLEAALRVRE